MGYYENSLQGYDIKSRDKWLSRNPRGTFLRENSGNRRSEVEDGETPGPRRLWIYNADKLVLNGTDEAKSVSFP